MTQTISAKNLPWVIGSTAALLYLITPSAFFNFDGVACAIAVDLSDLRHLTHGNHLAYGLVGLAFHRLWGLFGYHGPSIIPLQVFDSLLGGAGAGLLCSLLQRQGFSNRIAALGTLGMSVSYAYWFWSLEAQVYLLGAFFLIGAAREAFSEKPDPRRLGLWHAGAMLGHAGHVMFAPVALYALATSKGIGKKRPRQSAVTYILCAAAAVLSAYAAVALLIMRPESLDAWRVWLLGSAALTLDKSFLWHGGYSLESLAAWGRMTPRIFSDPAELSGYARAAGWILGLTALAGAFAGLKGPRRLVTGSLLWLASYAVLFVSWEPYTIVYRVTDLAAFWILISIGLRRAESRRTEALAAVFILILGFFNLKMIIGPRGDPANNRALNEARWLAGTTPADCWILGYGIDEVYIPYFGGRRTLNIRYFAGRPDALKARLAQLRSLGEPVYLTSSTLERIPQWESFLRGQGLKDAGGWRETHLYKIE